jgi:asparagine synthase (glutamine-hydrolysing)
LAHALSLYKKLNFDYLGISHSGQLGDVVFGSFEKGTVLQNNFKNGDGAYSKNLIKRVDFNKMTYNNYELFCMNQRGLNGANDGLMGIQQYTETMSPFYDIDVLNFAMTIPVKYRSKQKIYKKWIMKKYPEAANYIWVKTGEKINTPSFYVKNKEVTLHKLFRKLLLKMGLKKLGYNSKNNMNPLEYWLNTNGDLRKYLNEYFAINIDRIENVQLKEDCINHYNNGNGIEKMQVISLLSGLKLFFSGT